MAGPEIDEKDHAPESPAEVAPAASPPPEPPAAPPPRRGWLGRIFLSVLLVLLALGAAGYAALIFKDKDERIRLVADYVESGLAEAQAAFDRVQSGLADLLGESKAPQSAQVTTRRAAPVAPEPAPAAPPPPPPAPERAENAPEPTPLPPPSPRAALSTTEASAIEAANDMASRALEAAESARAAAESARSLAESLRKDMPSAAPVEAGDFSAKEIAAALEGRIDEIGDQLKALRDRLESPKNETRAAPDAAESPKAPLAEGPATMTVVAFALQRDLEAGRPYADEVAALNRLGADPAQIDRVSPLAEKGAPTPAQLRDAFAPVAKRLRAMEAHPGDLTQHLLQGASKLVRVHPTGQAPPESMDGKLNKIDAALAHGDLAEAERAFASLPESARAEAREFGEALRQRIEAGKAADELLQSAIAALGGAKK